MAATGSERRWLTRRCSRTGASVAALPLAPAAERLYRWADLAMSKRAQRHPDVPSFSSTLLDGIAVAVGRRAKALKSYSREFACTREASGNGERLNVDLETLEDRPTHVRLSVWEGGAVWLGVHQRATWRRGGWAFKYTGHGVIAHLEAAAIVAMLEDTRGIVYGGTRPRNAAERLDAIWASAHIEREA
jgi:hypothetical protein